MSWSVVVSSRVDSSDYCVIEKDYYSTIVDRSNKHDFSLRFHLKLDYLLKC